MNRRFWQSVAAAAVSGFGLAVLVAPPATAAATEAESAHELATTVAEVRAASAKWTPQAMRAAVPMDRLLEPASASRINGAVATGTPQTVQPTASGDLIGSLAFPNAGGEWTGGGAVQKTAGRVFFTYQGRKASCSGNAVTSANKSVVMTAGHCVKLDGAFHADWVFVPGYRDGATPYGTWVAKTTMATPQWTASEDLNYDIGAAVVNQLDGKSLTDVVGGQGIAFNQPRGQDMYAFGWPAALPYDGKKMIYCSGPVFDAFFTDGLGMDCDMTGGASGGPWFLNFSESTGAGIQNSVNSYKVSLFPFWVFGPYFGKDAQSLYDKAQVG